MLDKIDPSLHKALAVFIIIFFGVLVSVISSSIYLDNIINDERSAKRNMLIWKNKIVEAKDNNSIIVEYEKPYLALIDKNIVGDENRLSWFEVLQAKAKSRGLEVFKFSTSRQTKINPIDIDNAFKSLAVYKSVMAINMEISHEGDMFALFNDLEDKAKGLFVVDRCSVEYQKKRTIIGSKIKANCDLNWYTIKPEPL